MKLLDHVMKILERLIEGMVRKIVKIDEMQFDFIHCLAATREVTGEEQRSVDGFCRSRESF